MSPRSVPEPEADITIASPRSFYSSSNGDVWRLVPAGDGVEVEHQPNAASGGRLSRQALHDFLREGPSPQQQALQALIATLVSSTGGDATQDGERSRQDSGDNPAGPHATDDLTDKEHTPGAGALPDPTRGDVDPGAG
jgi:hypothetical protein